MNRTNLIAISGYIGSGKDLTASIIQYLTSNSKDIMGYEEYQTSQSKYRYAPTWEVKKFAEKLKVIASILTAIPREKFEDQEFKKTFLSKEWNYKKYYSENNIGQWVDEEMTVRELLQKLGTEAMRDGLHTNTWVNALFADYKSQGTVKSPRFGTIEEKASNLNWEQVDFPNWIISDLRFGNEYDAVKEKGGVCIKIIRLPAKININKSFTKSCEVPFDINNPKHKDLYYAECKQKHISETALDGHTFDYIIRNNGSIEDLVKEVEKMLKHFEII